MTLKQNSTKATASSAPICLAVLFSAIACSPANIARIGPRLDPRTTGCDIEILDEGTQPSRPFRNVGVIELSNCQDYQTPPCSNWLTEAVCEIGGHVAYIPLEGHVEDYSGPVSFRLLVGAYISDIRPDQNDIVLRSRSCNPPCGDNTICFEGKCVSPEDCKDKHISNKKNSFKVERCTE